MTKTDYSKHFKLFKRFDGRLREYCETRRPPLNYESTRKTFQTLKKREELGNKTQPKTSQKLPIKTSRKIPRKKKQKSKPIPPSRALVPPVPDEPLIPRNAKTISIKHQQVIDKYLECKNRTEAYMFVYKKCKYASAERYVRDLFRKPEVKAYLEYQRSLARSKTQVSLQKLVEAHEEVAFYDLDQEVNIDLSGLDSNGEGVLPVETKKYLRNTKVKYVAVKNINGGEDLERVIEYDIGLKYNESEIQRARNELYKLLIAENHDVSAQSTHEEVREAWDLFIKKEINAMEFCYILEKLQCKVPDVIRSQAEAEIKSMQDEGMLIIKDAIPLMDDKNFSVDDQLKTVIQHAAQRGNVNDMMNALKTLAAMKIIKTSFNFSMFAKFARMGFEGELLDTEDVNVIEHEAQKWEE